MNKNCSINTFSTDRGQTFAPVSNMLAHFEKQMQSLKFSEDALEQLKRVKISSGEINKQFAHARKRVDDAVE